MRLKRRNLIQGYIKVPEASKNGKQHLHVLFRGSYIDQVLIGRWWQEIHHARIVDIRKVKAYRPRKLLASYMAKYMSKENIYRYSWSWGWVWKGFCKDWAYLKKLSWQYARYGFPVPFDRILRIWHACLKAGSSAFIYIQPIPYE